MSYTKIQCIGMCICTTPSDLKSIEETSDEGYYAGYDDVAQDVRERLALIEATIAEASNKVDAEPTTLKVFVVPEFYFRGNKGAYYQPDGGSVEFFKQYLKEPCEEIAKKFPHWLFVLGTLLTSDKRVNPGLEPTKSLYHVGDDLLNVYHRLHPEMAKLGVNGESRLRLMLRRLDGKADDAQPALDDNAEDKAYQNILKQTIDGCESQAMLEVTNDCYIVGNDGQQIRTRRVLKEFKSKEDFILNSIEGNYTQTITKYKAMEPRDERKLSDLDDRAIFRFDNVWIGLDICLDHSRRRLYRHIQRHRDNFVDLQIITSCGMSVKPNAVIARHNCHVFNCDGEYTPDDGSTPGQDSHTTLQRVECAISPDNETYQATLDKPMKCQAVIPMQSPTELYRHGEYHLHIYPVVNVR